MAEDTLQRICNDKLTHIRECKSQMNEAGLRARILDTNDVPRGFHAALKRKTENQLTALIAEIKKASPSKGLIRADFNPTLIARAYETAGAACLSVLTDIPYFQGSNDYLMAARGAVSIPVLRKDFMLDTYQVTEARSIGADCILLIMAALEDIQAQELEAAALELGMDVLVEVHNAEEMARALTLRTRLLGINNRNLKTLEIDLATTELLATLVPDDYTLVCESGIYTPADIARMKALDIHSFLVGESLMREDDIEAATRRLLQG